MEVKLNVSEPWLWLIATGRKRVEGRHGKADKFAPGRMVFWSSARSVNVRVVAVRHYSTLREYLDGEGWRTVAPHKNSYEEALGAYHEIYSDAQIAEAGGINALEIVLV